MLTNELSNLYMRDTRDLKCDKCYIQHKISLRLEKHDVFDMSYCKYRVVLKKNKNNLLLSVAIFQTIMV